MPKQTPPSCGGLPLSGENNSKNSPLRKGVARLRRDGGFVLFAKRNWLIIVILLIASFLRLYRIYDYAEFLGDQGRDIIIVRDLLKNGNFFFIGPGTSIGNMYLGPFYYYLIAPALFFSGFNPIGPPIFIALLGVVTVYCLYAITRKWFGQNVALIASFLYAISPIVIKYSNFSWNPNIMPLCALLFIYFVSESKWLLASLAFIMALNSHYLALVLLPIGGIFWLIEFIKHKQNKQKTALLIKSTLLALIVFVISLIPQILFDIKHEGQNAQAMTEFFTKRETTVNIKFYKSFSKFPILFNQINTDLLFGKNQQISPYFSALFALLIIYLFYFYLKHKNDKSSKYFYLILAWYGLGILGLGLYKQHIYSHYFGYIFPVVFILAALCIQKTKIIGFAFMLALIVLSILGNDFWHSPPSQIRRTEKIVDQIINKANNDDFNLALIAKQNYDTPYRYFMLEKEAKIVDTNQKIASQLFVICEPHPDIDCNPINHPEWGIASFGWAKIDQQWEIEGVKLFKLVHRQK